MATFNLNNTRQAQGLDGTLVRLRQGMDPIWTSFGRDGYVLRTWEPNDGGEPGTYVQGTTDGRLAIRKADSGKGWVVLLFGEVVDEARTKSAAQCAAEDLIGVR